MIDKVIAQLVEAERVLLITHEKPDGDALGSMLALARALEMLGKEVTRVCVDVVPRPFTFLLDQEKIEHDCLLGNYDKIVILDCGDIHRTGFYNRITNFAHYRNRIINIDHHHRNDLHKIAAVNLVDYGASSTAEILFDVIPKLGVTIDRHIATCLLTGIYNDTGGFKHSNTSPKIMIQAAELLRSGARLDLIGEHVFHFKTPSTLRLWGIALSRLKYHSRLEIVISVITKEDLAACNGVVEDLAGCVNLINSLEKTKAAMLVYQSGNMVRVSLRTQSDLVDVASIAKLFGGGGIRSAAGFSFEGTIRFDSNHWVVDKNSVDSLDENIISTTKWQEFEMLEYLA